MEFGLMPELCSFFFISVYLFRSATDKQRAGQDCEELIFLFS